MGGIHFLGVGLVLALAAMGCGGGGGSSTTTPAAPVVTLPASGTVVLPPGFTLTPANLTVSSFLGAATVGTDDSFTVQEPAGGGPVTVMLTDAAGDMVMLGHVDTGNPSFNDISPTSTAEELIFLAAGCTTLPQSEWANIYSILAAAPETATLAAVISSEMAISPTAVGDQDPVIITAVNTAVASLLPAQTTGSSIHSSPPLATFGVTQQSAPTGGNVVSVSVTPSAESSSPGFGLVVAGSSDNTGIVITNQARINRWYFVFRTGYVPAGYPSTTPPTLTSPWVLVGQGFLPAVTGATGVVTTLIDYYQGKTTWAPVDSSVIPLPPTPAGVEANSYQVYVVGAGSNILSSLPADIVANYPDSATVANTAAEMLLYQAAKEVVWPIITKILPVCPATSGIWKNPDAVVSALNQLVKDTGSFGATYSSQLLSGGAMWPTNMTFFKAVLGSQTLRDAIYNWVINMAVAGAEKLPTGPSAYAMVSLTGMNTFTTAFFKVVKPIDALLTAADQACIFSQMALSNVYNIWDVTATTPTLILSPSSVTLYSTLQSTPFSVTSTGYGSSNLTYQWGPSLYGKFTAGGTTAATVTCAGNQLATYALAGTTFPLANDTFPVQVFVTSTGLSLGTIYGTVKFVPLNADRFGGVYSGTATVNGSPIPTSVGASNTAGTTTVSFEANFNDLFTWGGQGTENGNVAIMPDLLNGGVATWTILGPDWTTLTMSDPNAGYSGTFTRVTVDCPNLTGQTWNATLVVNATACGKSPCSVTNTYAITQSGFEGWLLWPYCQIFQASGSDGSSLSLYANANNQLIVSGSYTEVLDGSTGTTTVSGTLDLSEDETTYSGQIAWTWSDSKGSCGGTTAFSATISPAAAIPGEGPGLSAALARGK
jgi:hypothetical protein